MKKHLLLILALLAFVLPARAQSEPDMLYNFKNNSTASTYGTTFGTSVDIDNVIANVTGVDVTDYGANAKNYVSAITEATNVAYNSKGGVYMKAGGKLTFTLKKGYKVTGYQFMGQQVDGTTATITLNGINFDGPTETQASGQYSRLYPVPSEVKTVNSITISSNKNVYIKSVGIYIEAEASDLTVNVAPPAGTYNVGQVVMASANNTSANVQMIISKIEGDNYTEISKTTTTGYNSYTFSEAGKYQVIAQAYTGNWQTTSNYFCEEYTIVGTSTPATLSVNLKTGSYKLPQTVTVTSSKTDDDIIVILTNENDQEVVNSTFKGSWNRTFTTPGTFALEALNGDGATISEIYELGYAPEAPVFSKANGAYTNGTEVTISSKYATKLAVKIIKKADYDANGFNATGTQAIYDADSHTLTLTEDVVIVAQGKNDFGTTSTVYRIYTISNPVKPNVAPVISFSHEDQKVFGSEVEIDVTLSLNPDVYPVPEVIYYTLDGFMAHNTLETGKPGATPAGHVLTVAVDPATLSGTVRIERSHREALNHRAVTINAYTFNTAGSDVAAATYIFNDNAAPAPQPEPTTITATVTMANQGWTSGQSPYTNATTVVNWTSKLADGSEGPNFSTKATAGGPKYYSSSNGTLRIYSGNVVYVTAPEGYVFVSAKANFSNGALQMKPESVKEYTAATSETAMVFTRQENAMRLRVESGSNAQIKTIEYVLTKTNSAAAATAAAPATIKTATGDVYNLVTDASQIKAGDQLIIASHYYKTGNGADDNHYVLKSVSTKGTGVKNTSLNSDNSTLTESSDCLVFTVEVDGTKDNNPAFLLKNGNNYLSGKNNNNGLSLASKTNISYCTITNGESGWGDNAMNVYFYNCGTGGNLMCYTGTTFNAYKSTSCSNRSATNDQYSNVILYRKSTGDPSVEAPVISLSEHANTTEPVTVTIDCATEGATVTYTVKKDGTTVADNLPYDAANKPVFSEVGSYTVDATATLGTASANATQVSFEITEPEKPTVATPVITLSTQAKASDPVTVTIDCATDGATINYTVTKDGTTVADNLTYDPASKPVFSEVGSYTVNATASKEGMNPANAAPANFTIEKLVEVVEELFFVMDQNLWDVDGAYPETVVPFVYDRENGWYDLDIASIPATGWRQTAEGWFEINGGFRGNFYVRDGKANRKGLVFGAAGTVANTTYATRAAADGNQLVEPGVEYNMYIAGEGDTHKVFTTIGDDTNSKAFSAGTIRVTHTPGNKDAAKPMTLQILANSDQTTGVDSITAEDAASDADARFFNLQGVEVPADRLAPGIYIRQAGSKATKVLVK